MNNTSDRKLAAIMFADIVSYSRLMGANEEEALKLLNEFEDISSPIVLKFGGAIIKKNGDQIFCEFASTKNAVDSSIEIQKELNQYNDSRPKDFKLEVRIGIHIGDVVKREDGDIHGDGVNVAARIQPLASPGGICISGAVSESLSSHPNYEIISKGKQELKNILQKHSIFQIKTGYESIAPQSRQESQITSTGKKYWILGISLLLVGFFIYIQMNLFNKQVIVKNVDTVQTILFGKVFSDKENIEDIMWFYEKIHGIKLPNDLMLNTLSKLDLDNVYDELLSSIRVNIFISQINIDTKYDLDKYYKEINDLVPDYKLKLFNLKKKIATGELDLSNLSENSEDLKLFLNHFKNSCSYIMSQYNRIELGYFPVIYKLNYSYEGNDYLLVNNIIYDKDPSFEGQDLDSKFDFKLVKDKEIISELTNMLTSKLSNIIAENNLIVDIKSSRIKVTKTKGDKILFHYSKQDSSVKPRMIFEVHRDYIKNVIHDLSQFEAIAKLRFDDLKEYKNKVDQNKDSKQYTNFYNKDTAFENIIEYESLINKTHFLNNVTATTNISFILPLGISVKVDEVFDSTGYATIYKREDPFHIIKAGDILSFK